jgi:acetylornithine deacetylase/succinyl-diaminopimelate desuccinylase-like protein
VVFGQMLKAGQDKPTVLVYGHYDVQPPEPLELWHSSPFEPELRGANLYGRGASDMKGQVMTSLMAVEALVRTGGFPVNVKFIIEGEEEVGSPSLDAFLAQNKDLLACDFAINPDTGMINADTPTITYALRGLGYFEIRLSGPDHDLHSGLYGGAVHNPAQVLCELIAGMHDDQGRVTLPGFYDTVRPLDPEERRELARLPMDEAFYLDQTGVPQLYGEAGYTSVERTGGRPTLEVNGLYSGYIGEGSKTVLPAKAMAKVSMRLVPDQTPEQVFALLRAHLDAEGFSDVQAELVGGEAPGRTDPDDPFVQLVVDAAEGIYDLPMQIVPMVGGSGPNHVFLEYLKLPVVTAGVGHPGAQAHAPNENLRLDLYLKGAKHIARILEAFGAAG